MRGIWAVLRGVWPQTRPQRCWNHRTLNVLDKLPKRLWRQVKEDVRAAANAPTRMACQERLELIAGESPCPADTTNNENAWAGDPWYVGRRWLARERLCGGAESLTGSLLRMPRSTAHCCQEHAR